VKNQEEIMPTLLQAQQALDVAVATHKRAKTSATFAVAQAAFDALALAQLESGTSAKAAETLKAKVIHREKYEKTTTEVAEKSEKAMDSAAESEAESAPATVDSEAESKKPAFKKKAKGMKDEKAEETEDEEEKALAAFSAANKAYKAKAVGLDVYGARGPESLLKACFKAFGVSTIGEVFGALAGVPEKNATHADLTARLAKLEAKSATSELDAMLSQAKLEGRTRGPDDLKDLRGFAAEFGLKALKRRIKDREPKRTTQTGYFQPAEDATGNAPMVAGISEEDIKESITRATAGMDEKERKIYEQEFRSMLAKNKQTAVAV
jgi:hypothetical protein